MRWFHSVVTRLQLMFARRAADARMDDEIRFHLEMESDRLVRAMGVSADEARRQAYAAFGGVEKHKEALREGRGLAWLGGLSLDVTLGLRMLIKYPGLTLAGGLAIAVAIGVGAGWYDLIGKVIAPAIPLPEGEHLVVIDTHNAQTSEAEARVARDFLEWRRELRAVEQLGAYRTDTRNLVVGRSAPEPVQVAELTADAFAAARVPPMRGRPLVPSDETPGAPSVVVVGYDVWQRSLGGREDVVGTVVSMGTTPATVVGVMPKGFGYPFNHDGWMPLSLRASYEALEGAPISVVGRLAPGFQLEQANAELRVIAGRAAAAFPATHQHLRPRIVRFGHPDDFLPVSALAARHLPAFLVLAVACMSVGTLVYARTATREGEIAIRSALGAGRARIVGQLFVEALVLASASAAVGLVAVDRTLAWCIDTVNRSSGGAPFWMVGGLEPTTMLYAVGLAVIGAVMLSLLPALRITRGRLQPHLGAGRATLRFGRLWTAAMIAQVALTAMCIPGAMESTRQTLRKVGVRAQFPSREYLAARIDLDQPFEDEAAASVEGRRTMTFAALAERMAQEPGVVAVTFADRVPGVGAKIRYAQVESAPAAGTVFEASVRTSTVAPDFFAVFDRPIVAGRAFHAGDASAAARTVIVNEAFARAFTSEARIGSPIGSRLRYRARKDAAETSASEPGFDVIGVVRDFNLDPDDDGNESPIVFHAALAGALPSVFMSVRTRGTPAAIAARLPVMAAAVDARIVVHEALAMEQWVRDATLMVFLAAELGVTGLVLFLSALGLFSLVSVGVSRRTREIGLRVSLGATPRHVLTRIIAQAMVLMGSGIVAGGALLALALAFGMGPYGEPAKDIPLFSGYFALTCAVMLVACLIACIGPASRALSISPAEALKET